MVHFFKSHSHSRASSPSPSPRSASPFRHAKHPESSSSSVPCKLKIRFPHNRHIAFLYPDYIDDPEHVEVAMTVVEGVVDVELPASGLQNGFLHEQDALAQVKARKVKSLYVELIGEQTLQFGQHNEKYETVHYRCEIVSSPTLTTPPSPGRQQNSNVNASSSPAYTVDQALLPGKTYSFPWSFIVYGNTAPYERIPGGLASTFHFVKAHLVLEGDEDGASAASGTTESASNSGKSEGIVVEQTRKFTLVVNRNAYNAPPQGLEHNSVTSSNDLGAVSLSYFSKYLIVSSYLWCSVSFPDLLDRPRVEVQSVTLVLSQFATWQDLENPESEKTELPVLKYDFSLEKKQGKGKGRGRRKSEAAGVDEEEEEWEKQIRLPDEHHLRPSTSDKSITGIRVRHSLTVWVTYKVPREGEKKRRIMRQKLERPVTIGACHTMRDNLELPAYSPLPSPMASRPSSPTNLNTDNRSSFMSEQDEIECLCMRTARQSIQERYGLTQADLGRLARERESRSASRAGSRAASRAASRNPSPVGDGEGMRRKERERDHP